MPQTLEQLLDSFGIVTVMNIKVLKLRKKYGQILHQSDFSDYSEIIYLDTLKVSNISESGPSKTFKAGIFNIPIVQCGKTVKMEIKDALGKLSTLINFFNLKNTGNRIYRDINYSEPIALEGELKIINPITKEINTCFLLIPCFLPNGNISIIGDADKDIGVFDLSGVVYPAKLSIDGKHIEFYSISKTSILSSDTSTQPIFSGEKIGTNYYSDTPFDSSDIIKSGDEVIIHVDIDF